VTAGNGLADLCAALRFFLLGDWSGGLFLSTSLDLQRGFGAFQK
jgi:hypothetical protein